MNRCRICGRCFSTLVNYFNHCRFHSSLTCGALCPASSCGATFKSYATFISHLNRAHKQSQVPSETRLLICPVAKCTQQVATRSRMISHISDHLKLGKEPIVCPFTGCISKISTRNAFRMHVSRYHHPQKDTLELCHTAQDDPTARISEDHASLDIAEENPEEPYDPSAPLDISEESPEESHDPSGVLDIAEESSPEEPCDQSDVSDHELFRDNAALFFLRLEAQHHIPADTVQYIVSEVDNLQKLSQKLVEEELAKILPSDTLELVLRHFKNNELDIVTSGSLKSSYLRHKYFKKHFHFVKPVQINLGTNKQNFPSFFHYVPVHELIVLLMSNLPQEPHRSNEINECFTDFTTCKQFQSSDDVIQVILYQDEFELSNPLGSAKGNFKLLGVYLTLGNLPQHCRARTESMQLVLLALQKNVKEFGLKKILQPLIDDLCYLERVGLEVKGKLYRVQLCFIVGDNLGSHAVGGFTQNFSTSAYFCRFCLVTRTQFHEDPTLTGERRSVENYETCFTHDDEGCGMDGVVCESPFNVLSSFHVCQAGLPPCIGHDMFEGVVQYDLPLFIRYFVRKGWFSYDYLNIKIMALKYSARDLRNRPCKVSSKSDKLAGHAMQNWTFLRLLPLYVGDKVIDPSDSVWQLSLELMELVDLLMAPKITYAQVAYLKVLIQTYIHNRKAFFPDVKLRPKHHYMLHYGDLIQEFGPLSHVWTLRFESKHQYFKNCIRSTKNFKNVTKTLSERHQFFQAFLTSRGLFPPDVELHGAKAHKQPDEVSQLSHAFADVESARNLTFYEKAVVKGTTYVIGDYVLISGNRFEITFGVVTSIRSNASGEVAFLLQCVPATLLPAMCLYSLQDPTGDLVLLNQEKLLDSTSYRPYSLGHSKVIRLNFAFPEKF